MSLSGGIGGTLDVVIKELDLIEKVQNIEGGDYSAAVDVAADVTGISIALGKLASVGPRPLIAPGTAAAETVELAGSTAAGAGAIALGFVGGSRIYYNQVNAGGSEAAVDAISSRLGTMQKEYSQLLKQARNAGVKL